jgi:hypothetical protein
LAASVGATLHKIRAVRHTFAFLGASVANVGAHAAYLRMIVRHPQHKIRARQTNLNAVLKQPDVFGGSVFAAHFQTMTDGFQTNCVAVLTIINALLHFLTSILM